MGGTKDHSGAFFIDRDPTHFRYVLNFLRDGSIDCQRTDARCPTSKEAEFSSRWTVQSDTCIGDAAPALAAKRFSDNTRGSLD